MSNDEQKPKTGWWNPKPGHPTSKYHYVNEHGLALCKRWQHIFGAIEQGKDDSPDNCTKCKTELKKLSRPESTEGKT